MAVVIRRSPTATRRPTRRQTAQPTASISGVTPVWSSTAGLAAASSCAASGTASAGGYDVRVTNTLFLDTASHNIITDNPVNGWVLDHDTIFATQGGFELPSNGTKYDHERDQVRGLRLYPRRLVDHRRRRLVRRGASSRIGSQREPGIHVGARWSAAGVREPARSESHPLLLGMRRSAAAFVDPSSGPDR